MPNGAFGSRDWLAADAGAGGCLLQARTVLVELAAT